MPLRSTRTEPGVVMERRTTGGGGVCNTCGGVVPETMPGCPTCEPGMVLASAPTMPPFDPASRSSPGVRSVPLRPALRVLRRRPTLLLPPAVGTAAVVGTTTHLMGRVDLAFLWLFELVALLLILAVGAAIGFTVLTFTRAFTVAAVVNHFAGVARPMADALAQVLRRPGSVLPWVAMHGMVGATYGLAMLLRSSREPAATIRYEPGYASLRDSRYVWQVLFGEDAGLARAMDRSTALVRAGLRGSQRFSLFVGVLVAVVAFAWTALLLVGGLGPGVTLRWTAMVFAVTVGLSVWAALADVIDTACWHVAYHGRAPAPFSPWQLGAGLDLPPADA